MDLAAFLKMAKEIIEASPARITWGVSADQFGLVLNFDTRDGYHARMSLTWTEIERAKEPESLLRFFVDLAVRRVHTEQMKRYQLDWRSPWETEY